MIKKEEYLDMIAELIPGDSDEDLEKIEKLTEVYPDDDELNTLRDQLKEANDRAESLEKEWRKKFRERFLNGKKTEEEETEDDETEEEETEDGETLEDVLYEKKEDK